MRKVALGTFTLIGLLLGTAAHAAIVPAFSVVGGTPQQLGNPPFTIGFEFTANSAFRVNQLGFYDAGSDGLIDSHEIGLFDSSGMEIAFATLSSGASGTLVDGFRYVTIGSTLLTAGQNYYVGALYLTGDDQLIFPDRSATVTSVPTLTFVGATFASGNVLQAPTAFTGGAGYFGPNIAGVSAVPLPASAPMFGAAVLALGLVGYGVKRKKAAA